MTTKRVLAYGIGGIIAGLLLENTGLHLRRQGGQKLRNLKKKAGAAGEKISRAMRAS